MVPALFMTTVVVSYLFTAPSPEGFGLGVDNSLLIAVVADAVCLLAFARYRILVAKGKLIHDVSY